MSLFHFCLSAAKNLSSFQLLPASLITDHLQLFCGLPLFLFPWGFQCRAAFGISPSSFLNVWPIHLNFLFLISKFISSCPVAFHRSLLEIIFGHHILSMYLRTRNNNDLLSCTSYKPMECVHHSNFLWRVVRRPKFDRPRSSFRCAYKNRVKGVRRSEQIRTGLS